jgi:2-polyprenyl-6-hydroxyphenyl methylase/3-demethylubiquinone-9 3-methyltransferase
MSMATVDNAFYDTLDEAWYDGRNVAMAILRKEAEFKNAWIRREIAAAFGPAPVAVLDVGCGGGFVSNDLAGSHVVTGLDRSRRSLAVARRHDRTRSVRYVHGDAYHLPFADQSFSVVCAMDLLEHLEEPERCLAESARVLKPGGLLFFQTYNRTPLAYVFFVWGVNRTPGAVPNTHVYRLFIAPGRLRAHCSSARLDVRALTGFAIAPTWPALKTVFGRYDGIDRFRYQFTSSLAGGYLGFAEKAACTDSGRRGGTIDQRWTTDPATTV